MSFAWTQAEYDHIQSTVFSLISCQFPKKIHAQTDSGLIVDWDGEDAVITAEDKSALARGLFLLGSAAKAGKRALHVNQHRHFASCGVYVDCSRGAVMTVDACKRYMDNVAALGMNFFMLYTEDTYTVPEYPYFGHLRGRYTPEEYREINAYAQSMGIELIPSIQTLAHLENFLQWRAADPMHNTDNCLFIDEEETYRFIEAEVRAMRSYVTTKHLHIGMDEAQGFELGKYLKKHGHVNAFELLNRHLQRVLEICQKYDFQPMMWSDMYFRTGSKTGSYYDTEAHIPQEIIDNIPPVEMIYWDYYHDQESTYDALIAEHRRMGKQLGFAGGICTWNGFLPRVGHSEKTMHPALKCCLKHGIDRVMVTLWGDDGNETDYFLALHHLPLFSEYCWLGEACTQEHIAQISEALTGLPYRVYQSYGLLHDESGDSSAVGCALVYADLLYHLVPRVTDIQGAYSRLLENYRKGRAIVAPYAASAPECRYAQAVFDVVIAKCSAILKIRNAYAAHDLDALRAVADEDIPAMLSLYERMENEHRIRWEASSKPSGWELFPLRYGAVCGRLKDVARTLRRYADGEVQTIYELDQPVLPPDRTRPDWFSIFISPRYQI